MNRFKDLFLLSTTLSHRRNCFVCFNSTPKVHVYLFPDFRHRIIQEANLHLSIFSVFRVHVSKPLVTKIGTLKSSQNRAGIVSPLLSFPCLNK